MIRPALLLLPLLFVAPRVATAADTSAAAGETPAPAKILDHVDDLFRGDESHGQMQMQVVTKHFTRDLTLEEWSKGKDRFLVRILAPPKERGTATLRIGSDVWNYLPRVDRVIKVPSSLMNGAWMGSHVTNDDLVKMSRMSQDYTPKVTFEGARDGAEVIELTLAPKPDAAVVWGKVVVTVRRGDLLPLSIADYDESGKIARTTTFSDVKKLGGRMLPAKMTVVPADKPDEHTTITWTSLDFSPHLGESFFSLRNLKS